MEAVTEALARLDLQPSKTFFRLSPTPSNLQKCYLPVALYRQLQLRPGRCGLLVSKAGRSFVCRPYPKRTLPSNVVEFDETVTVDAPLTRIVTPLIHRRTIKSLTAKCLFQSPEKLALWRKQMNHLVDMLKRYALRSFALLDGCNISTLTLPPLKRIGIVTIECDLDAGEFCDSSFGVVTDDTSICVECELSMPKTETTPQQIPTALTKLIVANTAHSELRGSKFPHPAKQVLLVGPSGCGKTSLVTYICNELRYPIMYVADCNVSSSEPGQTEAKIKELFESAFLLASTVGKCIVVLDEIDNFCPSSPNLSSHAKRKCMQILHMLDRAQNVPGIIVLATTDRPENLNPALRRHGRLGTEIYLAPPTENQRKEILSHLVCKLNMNLSKNNEDLLCSNIASMTPGFVGADLKLICQKVLWMEIMKKKLYSKTNDISFWTNIFKLIISEMTPVSFKNTFGVMTTKLKTFDDLAGLKNIKKLLEVTIIWPLKHPEIFRRMGISRPKGILLHGPPGCAKTSLVTAIASTGLFSLLCVSGADLYSPYVGDAERLIVQLFDRARQNMPCLIFIDEIDAIAGSRRDFSSKSSDINERILASLLTQMDGIGNRMLAADLNAKCIDDGITVIGATNRPDMIDPALLRPGRFDRHIYVPPPNYDERIEILKLITTKIPTANDFNIHKLASETEDFSGADLNNLCIEAALLAMSESGMSVDTVEQSHFEHALLNA